MVNAKELRYGNKLLFLGKIVTFENITQFREDGIFWIKTKEVIESKSFHFKPIPLTEEILLKCGFVQCENEYWYTNGFLDLSLPIGTFCINGSKNSEAVIRINPIKHLHQLQNLYFALTNEELTVNL